MVHPIPRSWARAAALAGVFIGTLLLTSCAGDTSDAVTIRRVPDDFATIQAAVDAAREGDLVLVEPGVYHEAVRIETDGVVLRGTDRNGVVLDGEDRLTNGVAVSSDGVAVENLTVRRYQQNGVVFNGTADDDGDPDADASEATDPTYGTEPAALVGYRVSHVTASNNGLYGIYAFASRGGLIEDSYASGHPDSGIYVGQCKPCDVVIRRVTAEHNAIGYYGTNASGGVYVVQSRFAHNRLGITPNSQQMELLAPQVDTVVAGNTVVDNDDPDTPEVPNGFFGGGIAIGGGTANIVVNNRVSGHPAYGIGVVLLGTFNPERNEVRGNVVAGNEVDLAYLPDTAVRTSLGNCFAGNEFSSSVPADIETAMPCPGSDIVVADLAPMQLAPPPPGIDYRDVPLPALQPSMPDAATAPWTSASPTPPVIDLATIEVPAP